MTNGLNLSRFVVLYLGMLIGIPILLALIEKFLGFDLGSSAVAIIPIMIAALDQGSQYGNRNDTPATSAQMWRFAGVLGLLGAALSAVVTFAALKLMPGVAGVLSPSTMGMVGGIMLLIGVILFPLLSRWFFGQGMRNALKLKAKKEQQSK